MQSHWYVVQAISGQEKKVQKYIEEDQRKREAVNVVEEVLVPSECISEMKQGEQKIREKNTWPGYLLIKMILSDESWMYVKKVPGVIGFLGGGKPIPLPDEEVEEIRKRQGNVVQKDIFQKGDSIKIKSGVFQDSEAFVCSVNREKGKLDASISIFGRDTIVKDLEFWQVEKSLSEHDRQGFCERKVFNAENNWQTNNRLIVRMARVI